MEIYLIVKTIMDERNLKVADIAKLCDLPDSTVRGIIVRKQKSVALEVAFKLSKGLGISLEALNGDSENVKIGTKEDHSVAITNEVIRAMNERPILKELFEKLALLDDQSLNAFWKIVSLGDNQSNQ